MRSGECECGGLYIPPAPREAEEQHMDLIICIKCAGTVVPNVGFSATLAQIDAWRDACRDAGIMPESLATVTFTPGGESGLQVTSGRRLGLQSRAKRAAQLEG